MNFCSEHLNVFLIWIKCHQWVLPPAAFFLQRVAVMIIWLYIYIYIWLSQRWMHPQCNNDQTIMLFLLALINWHWHYIVCQALSPSSFEMPSISDCQWLKSVIPVFSPLLIPATRGAYSSPQELIASLSWTSKNCFLSRNNQVSNALGTIKKALNCQWRPAFPSCYPTIRLFFVVRSENSNFSPAEIFTQGILSFG